MTDFGEVTTKNAGVALREFRLQHHLTQTALRSLFVEPIPSQKLISDWERGMQIVGPTYLPGVAALLECSDVQVQVTPKTAKPRSSRVATVVTQPATIDRYPFEPIVSWASKVDPKEAPQQTIAVTGRAMLRELRSLDDDELLAAHKAMVASFCTVSLREPNVTGEVALITTRVRRSMQAVVKKDPSISDNALLIQGLSALQSEAQQGNKIYGELDNWPALFATMHEVVAGITVAENEPKPLFTEQEAGIIIKNIGF